MERFERFNFVAGLTICRWEGDKEAVDIEFCALLVFGTEVVSNDRI
jgi:hypothetical protein